MQVGELAIAAAARMGGDITPAQLKAAQVGHVFLLDYSLLLACLLAHLLAYLLWPLQQR
jgi:hypothetical protein